MLLLATGAHAQDVRLEGRSVLMFNQHLYFGSFDRPRALAYDAAHEELWMADAGTGRIGVFRPDGGELYSFTSKQHLRDVSRIALAPDGGIAVVEGKRAEVRRFNYRGEYKGTMELEAAGHDRVIGALAFDSEGNLYVGDNATAEVFVYTPDGKRKFEFGSRGTDEGQFQAIGAITVGPDGTIYVTDQQAIAVQLFDRQGNFIRGWGKHETGSANFSLPSGIALDAKGRIYVADELRHQVKIFTAEGALIGGFGGLGNGANQLSFPTDIAIDAAGRVYVSERLTARVQVFEVVEVAISGE